MESVLRKRVYYDGGKETIKPNPRKPRKEISAALDYASEKIPRHLTMSGSLELIHQPISYLNTLDKTLCTRSRRRKEED